MRVLLASQKQEIWSVLEAVGFDPTLFYWEDVDQGEALVWSNQSSDDPEVIWFFVIASASQRGHWSVTYRPGDQVIEQSAVVKPWSEVLPQLGVWAECLRRELDAIDPWQAADAIRGLLEDDGSDLDNSFPSPEEREGILGALAVLQRQVEEVIERQARGTNELKLYVARQFEVLREATATRGRRDFRQLVRDVLVGIVSTVTVNISPAAASATLDFGNGVLRALGH